MRRSAAAGAVVGVIAAGLLAAVLVGDGPDDDHVAATGSTTTEVVRGAQGGQDEPTTSSVPPTASPATPPAAAAPTTMPSTVTSPAPTPGSPPPVAQLQVRLTEVTRLAAPVAMAVRPGDSALYVGEKGGRVQALRSGGVSTLVDISGDVSTGSEQGLLGMAFHPGGDLLYVHFTDRSGNTAIDEWQVGSGAASNRRRVFSAAQPYTNHNGGMIAFGPDGLLYIGLGDGGSGGDPQGNAQNLGTVLGKILRIDPRPNGADAYRIPADNPYVGRDGARGEIWSYGLRNPWRFSFDRATGDLWIGDVGQNVEEEIDWLPAPGRGRAANYGWNLFEGTRRYGGYSGSAPADYVAPIHTYRLGSGRCAVTGGYVYRGNRIPDLRGVYVFGDYCAARLTGLRRHGDGGLDVSDLGTGTSQLTSFGEGPDGELYVMSLEGPVFRVDPA